jgi:hypothetical protein
MRRFLIPIGMLFVLGLTPASARAEGFITPYVGFNFGGDSANCASFSNCNERRLNWGVSLGGTNGALGFELDIAYAPDFFGEVPGQSSSVLTVMSNLLVIIPAGPVRPYALIGIGLMRPHFKLSNLIEDKNALGYDFGGGLNVFLARHVGLRGDVRRMRSLEDITFSGVFSGEKLDFWRASGGLTFRF